jgi:hypothetical protein
MNQSQHGGNRLPPEPRAFLDLALSGLALGTLVLGGSFFVIAIGFGALSVLPLFSKEKEWVPNTGAVLLVIVAVILIIRKMIHSTVRRVAQETEIQHTPLIDQVPHGSKVSFAAKAAHEENARRGE